MNRALYKVLIVLVAFTATRAYAVADLNLIGGASLLQGAAHQGYTETSPLMGASLLIGIGPFGSIGPIYENNLIFNGGSTGHRSYIGGIVHFDLASVIFVEGTLGATAINSGHGATSDSALGGGFNIGLNTGHGPGSSINPFLGYRYTPTKWGFRAPTETSSILG